MIVKYINEKKIETFKNIWKENGMVYTNEEARKRAVASGEWKELVIDEEPEYDIETQYLTFHYEEDDEYVYKKWITNDKEEELIENQDIEVL